MKKVCVLLVALLLPLSAFSSELRTAEAATDALVSILVDNGATEYPKARKVHYPKGESGPAMVFFTVEGFNGGNNYTQYLAVFEPSWVFDPAMGEAQKHEPDKIAKYRLVGYLPVGGKGSRAVDTSSIVFEKQVIRVQTKEYDKADAMCCPSKAGTATFKIEGRKISEVIPD